MILPVTTYQFDGVVMETIKFSVPTGNGLTLKNCRKKLKPLLDNIVVSYVCGKSNFNGSPLVAKIGDGTPTLDDIRKYIFELPEITLKDIESDTTYLIFCRKEWSAEQPLGSNRITLSSRWGVRTPQIIERFKPRELTFWEWLTYYLRRKP